MTTTKKETSKYTPAMEARIRAVAAAGALNLAKCAELATEFGAPITARGVVAKVRSMQLPYQKQERVDKSGRKVMTKDEIVSTITETLGLVKGDSLVKAEKETLRELADAVLSLTASDEVADEQEQEAELAVG